MDRKVIDDHEDEAVFAGFDSKYNSRYCHIFQKFGHCNRKFCTKEHKRVDPSIKSFYSPGSIINNPDLHIAGWTNEKVAVFTEPFEFLDLDLPKGSDLVILVTSNFENSHNRFYGRILNLAIQKTHGTLEQLTEMMSAMVSEQKLKTLQILPALGQLLVVQYENQFYRGRVFNFVDDEASVKLSVFFVDYGWEKEVMMKNAWEIDACLLHLPFQAVQFFHVDMGIFNIYPGSKLDATLLSVDSESNVEVQLQGVL